jgi:hypothetical protein
MAWTKAQIISDAFGELALAGHVFDIEPEEQQQAARRLEMMLATWEARGVTLGYSFAGNPTGIDVDGDSGLPDAAVETVVINLAKRISGGFGKALTQQQLQDARDSYAVLLRAAAFPREMQIPATMPRGAGVKPWRSARPFVTKPDTSPLSVNDGGDMDILRG